MEPRGERRDLGVPRPGWCEGLAALLPELERTASGDGDGDDGSCRADGVRRKLTRRLRDDLDVGRLLSAPAPPLASSSTATVGRFAVLPHAAPGRKLAALRRTPRRRARSSACC